MIDNDSYFEELEKFAGSQDYRKLPNDIKLTITYVTGEKEVFNVSINFWANSLLATKRRLKYFYINSVIINLDHVVKMEYVGLEKYHSKMRKGSSHE
ncbi:hypothetical protein NCCP2716_23390 [Sporosarcina sp. NCCP-2716]|uniref:hypothetical protein n=1 Tax=Sporosarcina sp. NCCP-2716 TaxID=2943679 RepID=UPI00203B0DF0|nr:hypothetical protein [Sporosarcina sp. NCCP-2716]GKV69841.1 hypothetical protein NCCP2716_23390 [Sporosarcina sp. NCCP-2716]